jgi:hypothetical protein
MTQASSSVSRRSSVKRIRAHCLACAARDLTGSVHQVVRDCNGRLFRENGNGKICFFPPLPMERTRQDSTLAPKWKSSGPRQRSKYGSRNDDPAGVGAWGWAAMTAAFLHDLFQNCPGSIEIRHPPQRTNPSTTARRQQQRERCVLTSVVVPFYGVATRDGRSGRRRTSSRSPAYGDVDFKNTEGDGGEPAPDFPFSRPYHCLRRWIASVLEI